MEQLKILQMIDRWNYLNKKQLALLTNKTESTVTVHINSLKEKKLILVNCLTSKNIYYLSALGRRSLGKESKTIKINFPEFKLQELLINWLVAQKNISEYKTQLELKHESPRDKVFPNLLIFYNDQTTEWVEFERTVKNQTKWNKKINSLNLMLKDNYYDYKLRWVTVNQSMANKIKTLIEKLEIENDKQVIEILNY